MKKRKLNGQKILQGARIVKWVFWGLILVLVAIGVMQLVFASNGPGEAVNLEQLISAPNFRNLVGIIAVVMVIIAGIVYAFDLGGGKQIGVAKEMITAAIGGVLLFIFASWLLTQIGNIVPVSKPNPSDNPDVVAPQEPKETPDGGYYYGGGPQDKPLDPGFEWR